MPPLVHVDNAPQLVTVEVGEPKDQGTGLRATHRLLQMSIGSAAACVYATLCQWPLFAVHPGYASLNVVVGTIVVACGLFMRGEKPGKAWADTLTLCGFLWSTRGLVYWDAGPWPIIAGYSCVLMYAVGATTLMVFTPRAGRDCIGQLTLFGLWVITPVLQSAAFATSRPEWVDFDDSVWWLGWWADARWFAAICDAMVVVDVAQGLGFMLALGFRLRAMNRLDRIVAGPIYVAAAIFGVVSTFASGEEFVGAPKPSPYWVVLALLFVFVPIGFVVSAVWRRLRHSMVSQVLSRSLGDAMPTYRGVERALREMLGDPSLCLYAWDRDAERYRWEGIEYKPQSGDRLVRDVRDVDGARLALVSADSFLERHPELLATALHVSSIALQNVRLQSDLQAQLREVQRSRSRLAEASVDERRRIERDLHDGVQQRLLAVVAQLGTARKLMDDEPSRELVRVVNDELRGTLQALRDLAHGIHPQELRQFGLQPAIDVVAERLPLLIVTDVASGRFPSVVESTIYFVVCEALTNAVKHAGATVAHVKIHSYDDALRVLVKDDGIGGADLTLGRGLTGCADRVRTLGGDFEIRSDRGSGTAVIASVPLPEAAL